MCKYICSITVCLAVAPTSLFEVPLNVARQTISNFGIYGTIHSQTNVICIQVADNNNM